MNRFPLRGNTSSDMFKCICFIVFVPGLVPDVIIVINTITDRSVSKSVSTPDNMFSGYPSCGRTHLQFFSYR